VRVQEPGLLPRLTETRMIRLRWNLRRVCYHGLGVCSRVCWYLHRAFNGDRVL